MPVPFWRPIKAQPMPRASRLIRSGGLLSTLLARIARPAQLVLPLVPPQFVWSSAPDGSAQLLGITVYFWLDYRVSLAPQADASKGWDLRCRVREALIDFLQREEPDGLSRLRAEIREGTTATRKAPAPPPEHAGVGDSSAIRHPEHAGEHAPAPPETSA